MRSYYETCWICGGLTIECRANILSAKSRRDGIRPSPSKAGSPSQVASGLTRVPFAILHYLEGDDGCKQEPRP